MSISMTCPLTGTISFELGVVVTSISVDAEPLIFSIDEILIELIVIEPAE